MEAYFSRLDRDVKHAYDIAESARAVGIDPEARVEIPPASDMATRVEKLLARWHVDGVSDRIRELSLRNVSRENVAITVAEEMAVDEAFGDRERRLDVAVRTGLAILTEGILVAPLEGLVHSKIREDPEGAYVDLYYAGPIRAAGGTAQALSVLLADVVRRKLGIAPYVATKEEIGRYKEEIPLYKHLQHLQYSPTPEEIETAVKNLPVCVNGEPTEGDEEVTAFRNVKRVDTAGIRGGACLVIAEGICQKAPKLISVTSSLKLDGWGFLKELGRKGATAEEGPVPKYLSESVGGRPVLAHPHRAGGFRLVYGRSRTSGLASASINPASMTILDDFVAIGTQLKVEYPGKASAMSSCDTIEGPLVLLDNGDFVAVNDLEKAKAVASHVVKVIDVGEMLVSYGEFAENNYPLVPGAYSLPWHLEEMRRKGLHIDKRAISPRWEEALEDARAYTIPLHPRFNLFWHDLKPEDLRFISREVETKGAISGGLLSLPAEERLKDLLLALGLLHSNKGETLLIDPLLTPGFLLCLGLEEKDGAISRREDVREDVQDVMAEVSRIAGIRVKSRGPSRIGARVGRPEKARQREMKPSAPHTLFPVGIEGGPRRAITPSPGREDERNRVEVGVRTCPKCGQSSVWNLCECGEHTESSGKEITTEMPVGQLFRDACERLKIDDPPFVKGVRGLISREKVPEPIEKGILRAQHHIGVYQDGTSRFDMTDIPLTHFRPSEIGLTVEAARKLGYEKDMDGNQLEDASQLLELLPQDIIVSRSCGDYLLRLSRFVDDELTKLYDQKAFYGAGGPEDMIGKLVITLAPHTSGGVLGRIIGYTDVDGCFAHPAFHASKRRNCDGDEDAVTLLMDGLLNFSFSYIPKTRGGMMDKPLVLTTRLNIKEVDKEAHNVDTTGVYPIEFYEAAERFLPVKEVETMMEVVKKRLDNPALQFSKYWFTHDTTDISLGPTVSAYRDNDGMADLVMASFNLAGKLRGVDVADAMGMVLNHHFLPDIMGNMKSYGTQKFRCKKCGTSYRRPPLLALCTAVKGGSPCGGELRPTVYEGAVTKYLALSKSLAAEKGVGDYIKQRVQILEDSLTTLFPQTQTNLSDYRDEEDDKP